MFQGQSSSQRGDGQLRELGEEGYERRGFAVVDPKKGSPVNAMFMIPSGAERYFEVTVLELKENCAIGVGTRAGFAAGWRCNGVFFGGPGNLSKGGELVRTDFGDAIRKWHKIGVLLQRERYGLSAVTHPTSSSPIFNT